MVYLDDFYWFPKFCKFLPKIARFLGKKHPFFCRRGKNLGKKISKEKLCVFSKKVQFLVEMFLRVPSRTSNGLFLIFWVLAFLQGQIRDKIAFFYKKMQKMAKNTILFQIWPYKKAKTQNIKKSPIWSFRWVP